VSAFGASGTGRQIWSSIGGRPAHGAVIHAGRGRWSKSAAVAGVLMYLVVVMGGASLVDGGQIGCGSGGLR